MRHAHTSKCWYRYEPCGEHHMHDYDCGGGELKHACPDFSLYSLSALEGSNHRLGCLAKEMIYGFREAKETETADKLKELLQAWNEVVRLGADMFKPGPGAQVPSCEPTTPTLPSHASDDDYGPFDISETET